MTKDRRRKRAGPNRTFAQVVMNQFTDSGEVTGFGALADQLDERGEHPEFAALLRELMGSPLREAVRFFYAQSGYVGCAESPDQVIEKRLTGALALAQAEEWSAEHCETEWAVDEDYDHSHYDDPSDGPNIGWGCLVTRKDGVQDGDALWAITFEGNGEPWDRHGYKPYARVVAAELAFNLMAQPEETP